MPVYKRTLPSGKVSIYVKGQIDKVSYWETVKGATTIAEGKRREREIQNEIELRRFHRRRPLLSEYIEKVYLPWSKENNRCYLENTFTCKALVQFFKGMRLDEIRVSDVRAFQAHRKACPTKHKHARKNSTVNREIAVLSRIFSMAMDDELISVNPCSKVRGLTPEPHRVVYLTETETERLLEQCSGVRAYLRDIVLVGINTGLRPGKVELLGLQVQNINFDRNTIELSQHKTVHRTGKPRVIPMNSTIRRVLLALCDGKQGNDHLFINKTTGAPYTDIKKAYLKACREAGIPRDKAFPYILRHTFATRLAQAGVEIPEIMNLLGHTSLEMTMRYVHPSARKVAEAVERIA